MELEKDESSNQSLSTQNSAPKLVKRQSTVDSFGNEQIEGAEVSWKNLSYRMPAKKNLLNQIVSLKDKLPFKKNDSDETSLPEGDKIILKPFSGTFKAKSLVAVMGSSGAGKTTFLNTLSYQFEGGIREGNVYINNRKLTKKYFKKTCGYVRQNDVLLPNLTVKETLTFYANLLLPMTMSSSEKEERVISTIKKLGLIHAMNTQIGNEFKKGISGGEKRRVTIAIELLKNPAVLFLDEPTSGLDSKTALNLINTLSELAHEYNHTIICTIHQPRSQIFLQFDTLLLLAKGSPVYFGEASEAINHFGALGYNCPQYENPPDYFIDLLTIDSESQQTFEDSTNRIAHLIEASKEYSTSTLKNSEDLGKAKKDMNISEFGTIVPYQIWLLFLRAITNTWRDTQYLFGRVAQTFFMAAAVAILWWQIDDDQTSIQDRVSVLFIILVGGSFPEGVVASLVFPTDRLVYLQEKRSGMYRVFSYYIAKQLAEFPLQILVPSIYIIIIYLTVGLQYDAVHFANVILCCLLLVFIVNSVGLLFGALFPAQIATVGVPVALIFAMLFAGFYVNAENIPVWLKWAKYASMFYYAFCGVIYTEFWGRDFECKSGQYITATGTGVCKSGKIIEATTQTCQFTHGQQIIDQFKADELELYQLELILLLFLIFFRLAILPALYRPPRRF